MFVYTKQYGLGAQEEDAFVRWVSVLGNLADQLYYPCEHVAWAADARVLHVDSSRWWTLSTTLWALSLLLGVASHNPACPTAEAGECRCLMDRPRWVPCMAAESAGSRGCPLGSPFLSLQMPALGAQGIIQTGPANVQGVCAGGTGMALIWTFPHRAGKAAEARRGNGVPTPVQLRASWHPLLSRTPCQAVNTSRGLMFL
nr:peroxisomal membrane protein 11C isoform X4 [Pongo pygmaeus]